ncbi:MAG: hypothetical protein IIY88_03390 [Eubacterium sp.]|nr:hypothetical protein [Eubacterium sp.]
MKSRKYSKTIIAFVAALIIVLAAGTVGVTRSALSIFSDEYPMQFEMYHIGITLNENDKPLAWRNYLEEAWHTNAEASLLGGIEKFSFGTTYDEKLSVTNSGAVDEYVRVTIYKYWLNEDGSKAQDLDPGFIDIKLVAGDNGWILDDEYSGDGERVVLYYTKPLSGTESGNSETTPYFTDTVTVDGDVKLFVTQTETTVDDEGYTVVTNKYTYDGKTFCIDVQADGVQTHNAEDAIKGAWGRTVTIDEEGILSLEKEA